MKLSDNSYIEIGPDTFEDEVFISSTSVIAKKSTKHAKGCAYTKSTKGITKDKNTCHDKKSGTPTFMKSSSTIPLVMKSSKDANNTQPTLCISSNFNSEVIDLCESSDENIEERNVLITEVKVNKKLDI